MAEISFSRVLSVSSEDPRFPASSLLQPQGGGRWLSATGSEKQISVVLEVRRLGPFRLLEESSSSSQRPLGALFYQRPAAESTPVQACPGPSYAAAALQSSPKPPKRRPPALAANGTPPSKQPAPGPAPEPPSPAPRPSSPAPEPADSARNASSSAHKASSPAQKSPSSSHASSPAQKASSPAQKATNPAHRATNPAHKASSPAQKAPSSSRKASSSSSPKGLNPAHKAAGSAHKASSPASKGAGSAPVLGGVVFALSGFQNPLRSQLREAALGLGAAYSPDWSEACTHLVSAFPRTPKASRARALGGVLIGPSWIWDCQKQQRRLPCGPYLLAGSGSASSDAEEEEEEAEPAAAPPPARSSPTPEETTPPAPAESPPPGSDPPLSESGDSGSQSEGEDPYGGSTEPNTEEEEEEEEEEESIPTLPNFFEDKTFLLHGDFPPGQERLLQRYLTAFGGTLAPYMNDSVTHVVTAQDWDPAFEEALELRPSLTFVRPRWLLLCAQQQRPLPAQPFAVVPAP